MRLGLAVKLICVIAIVSCDTKPIQYPARYLGSFTWDDPADWFGGFSGLELSDDGQSMTLISDRSTILTAQITRDGDHITAITPGPEFHLKSSLGKPLTGIIQDSEGLAIAPDGTIYVSFEDIDRVARYDSPSSAAISLQRPLPFWQFEDKNGTLEALAIDDTGRLYTLPEYGADASDQFPVFRWDDHIWSQPFTLPARDSFSPVGADFGPDGRFYLLERTYNLLGFRSRLRRWDITDTGAENEEILLQTDAGTHDNLEGLSIWRDDTGRLRLTMISDDNFLFFQRTELVEYALTE